jgi:hypothetical protein
MNTLIVFAVTLAAGAEGPAGGNLVPFQQSGRWGFKDAAGKTVIEPKCDSASDFSEGLALVSDRRGKHYVDTTGKIVIDLGKVSEARDFHGGLALVYEDRSLKGQDWRTRCIDKTGRSVFTVDGYVEEFHEGLAVLSVEKRPGHAADSTAHFLSGYIDRSGKVVVPPRFDEAHDFSEGLAAVRPKKTTILGMGDTWGYIDKSGKYAIAPRFNEAGPFKKGVAQVHVGGRLVLCLDAPSYWEGGKWQFIDRQGKIVKQSDKWIPLEERAAAKQTK